MKIIPRTILHFISSTHLMHIGSQGHSGVENPDLWFMGFFPFRHGLVLQYTSSDESSQAQTCHVSVITFIFLHLNCFSLVDYVDIEFWTSQRFVFLYVVTVTSLPDSFGRNPLCISLYINVLWEVPDCLDIHM